MKGKNTEQQHSEPEDVSIIMAVYNHGSTVAEALESALMQEMPYSSVIHCFNDASTDDSAAILAAYSVQYPDRIKIYTSKENQGSGKKNYLHHRPDIQGRYWCFLAGDDYWTSRHKLTQQVAFLDAHPDHVGCSCNTIVRNEMTGEESIITPGKDSWNLMDLINPRRNFGLYVHTASILWRNIYQGTGFFLPPEFCKPHAIGDVVLMHMMLARGGLMHNLTEVMSCYRLTGHGVWSRLSEEEQALLNIQLNDMLKKTTPWKYKISNWLWFLRRYSGPLNRILPSSVHDC